MPPSTSLAPRAEVTPAAKRLTASRVQGHRLTAAADASTLYADAVHAAGATYGSVAASLDVHPSAPRAWGDPVMPAAVTLRDVLAGPRAVRAALGHALLALDAPLGGAPTVHALTATARIGELCAEVAQATAPGSPAGAALSPDERARLRALVARAQRELDAIARGCR